MVASPREPAYDRRRPAARALGGAASGGTTGRPPTRRSVAGGAAARIKRSFIWTHRWSSLVLGLALLVVTTSGVPLLYEQEITRAQHAERLHEAGRRADALLRRRRCRRPRRTTRRSRRSRSTSPRRLRRRELRERPRGSPSTRATAQVLGDFNRDEGLRRRALDDEPDDERPRLRAHLRGVRRLPVVAGRRRPRHRLARLRRRARHLGRADPRHHRPAAAVPRALGDLALVAGHQALRDGRARALAQGPLRARLRPAPGRRHDRACRCC